MLNMSQEHLGQALGLTFQQIQKYEKGLNRIGAGRLYNIAQVLNVEPAFFFADLPDPAQEPLSKEIEEQSLEVSEFIASAEGYSIISALSRIQDSTVRRRILDLARALGTPE